MDVFDCIVVGGGVIGSSAAYSLAQKNENVLLLDQFGLPHTRGSSHGPVRVLRMAHTNPVFAKMTIDSVHLYEDLEKRSRTKLLRKTGMIVIDKPPYLYPSQVGASAEQAGLTYSMLSRDEVHSKYPGLITMAPGHQAYYEEEAWTLRADKTLSCIWENFQLLGGKIQDEEKVLEITPGALITVRTNKGRYMTKGVVLAPGSWASPLLKKFGINPPMCVKRATVCYWKEPIPGQSADYPVFIDRTFELPAGDNALGPSFGCGFPSSEYPGLRKISIHYGCEINPDTRDISPDLERDMRVTRSYIKARFPEFGATPPSIVEPCIYTDTADGGIIIDSVPFHDNIVYCCGLSGTGFHAAPIVGQVLAESVMGCPISYDIASLSLARFPGTSTQSKY